MEEDREMLLIARGSWQYCKFLTLHEQESKAIFIKKMKKMKKLILGVATFSLISAALVSCKKETITTAQKDILKSSTEQVPTFQNHEELNSKIEELNAMGEDERRLYESNAGFKSLLTYVYEIYEGIDMEELDSKNKLETFVSENSSIVSIRINSDDELEYRPYYSDIDYSIIANTNRMFIVGELCYKIFDDGIVVSQSENIDLLNSLNQISAKDVPKSDRYEISVYFEAEIDGKSTCHPTNNQATVTSGSNRTKLKCITGQQYYGEMQLSPNHPKVKIYGVHAFGRIRPYKRTLGIWYHARRTISGRIQFTVSWKNGNTPVSASINSNVGPSLSYSQTRSFDHISTPLGEKPKEIKFTNINSWGTTPNTGNVTIICF